MSRQASDVNDLVCTTSKSNGRTFWQILMNIIRKPLSKKCGWTVKISQVNGLSSKHIFQQSFVMHSHKYFLHYPYFLCIDFDQTTTDKYICSGENFPRWIDQKGLNFKGTISPCQCQKRPKFGLKMVQSWPFLAIFWSNHRTKILMDPRELSAVVWLTNIENCIN